MEILSVSHFRANNKGLVAICFFAKTPAFRDCTMSNLFCFIKTRCKSADLAFVTSLLINVKNLLEFRNWVWFYIRLTVEKFLELNGLPYSHYPIIIQEFLYWSIRITEKANFWIWAFRWQTEIVVFNKCKGAHGAIFNLRLTVRGGTWVP